MQVPRSGALAPSKVVRALLPLAALAALLFLWGGVLVEILRLVFGGAVIAFLLAPLARLLERRLPRPAAALISLALIAGALAGLAALLAPLLARQFSELSALLPDALSRLRAAAEALAARVQARLPGLELAEFGASGAERALSALARRAALRLSAIGGGAYRMFLMIVLGYFLLADRARVLLRMELFLPARHRSLLVRMGKALARELRLYLRGQATIALAVGALAAALLLFLGVPGAPLLGALVGLFNVIPYFGPLVGGAPAVLAALALGWQAALGTLAALFLVQQVDGLVISPRVMGGVTGLSPAIVLLALYAGARAGGIGGMLLALPALMSIRTLYRVFVQRREND